MFAAWMHPRGFLVDRQSEDGVGDQEVMRSTCLKKEETIVIASSNSLRAKDPGPGLMILANSGVEIAKKNEFVLFWHRRNDLV